MAIIDLVKYDGRADVFAWKFPNQQLSTWTQLIVNESQEAILFKGGKALDLFTAGRYTLDTQNIPLLTGLIGLPFGGKSPFTAEIWFVNKAISMDIKWGTPTPIQLQDSKYGVFLPVRSHGQFGITIQDSLTFLKMLVGTLPVFNKENVNDYFKGIYLTKVKDAISSYIIEKGISVLEINTNLEEISEYIYKKMVPEMAKYGIKIVNFNVNDISVPEDDEAVIKLKAALSKRAEMNIIGYSYQQERSFDTLEGAAKNEGTTGTMIGAGLGLGLGMGVGDTMGQRFGDMAVNINTTSNMKECPKCHQVIEENIKFCPHCGSNTQSIKKDVSTCPHCQAAIPTNAKFCPECGNALKKVCAKCGHESKANAKFCPECGDKL